MFLNDINERNILVNEAYEHETVEGDILIMEALIEELEGEDMLTEEEMFGLVANNILSEKSIVRLDKHAHKQRAIKKAALIIAKEKNDQLYKKLKKVYALKKKYTDAIMKKYGSKANARIKKNVYNSKGILVKKEKGNIAHVKAIQKVAKNVMDNSAIKANDIAANPKTKGSIK